MITRNKLRCDDYNKFYSNNIASIVYNSSKPNRNKLSNSYIIHSSPNWTKQNLSLEKQEAELKIVNLLEEQLNQKIEIEFSTKFLLLMSEFSSLNSTSNLHFSSDYPMKMCLSLDHWMEEDDENEEINSYIKFYLAPCVGDDDEIEGIEM